MCAYNVVIFIVKTRIQAEKVYFPHIKGQCFTSFVSNVKKTKDYETNGLDYLLLGFVMQATLQPREVTRH